MKLEKLAIEIMRLSIVANRVSHRAVFCNFAGHVNSLQLRIAEDKENYRVFYDKDAYIDNTGGDALVIMKGMKRKLDSVIKEAGSGVR